MSFSVNQSSNLVVVSNTSDNPFAIDIAYSMGQHEDIADLISMKTFMNSEFCPRFISDELSFTKQASRSYPNRIRIDFDRHEF